MDPLLRVLREVVEPARCAAGVSQRRAAERAGLSPTYWRYLVVGKGSDGQRRGATRAQVLRMAAAVDVLEPVGRIMRATGDELARAGEGMSGPGERELLAVPGITDDEKEVLLEALRALRSKDSTGS